MITNFKFHNNVGKQQEDEIQRRIITGWRELERLKRIVSLKTIHSFEYDFAS